MGKLLSSVAKNAEARPSQVDRRQVGSTGRTGGSGPDRLRRVIPHAGGNHRIVSTIASGREPAFVSISA
jgi:hypothetical protein